MKQETDAIFVGTVKSISPDTNVINSVSVYKVVFSVAKSWKTQNIEQIVLYTTRSGCSILFELGKTYLVYAKNNKNELITEICWGTSEILFAKKDLKYLGKPFFENIN